MRKLTGVPLSPLPGKLSGAPHRFGLFALAPLRRFFVVPPQFHLAKDAFPLHLFLQYFQRLIDVVVPHRYFHALLSLLLGCKNVHSAAAPAAPGEL